MANKYLHREDAPFGPEIWELIDDTVEGAAASQLAGRRLVEIEGPYGVDLKQIPENDTVVDETENGASVLASHALPVVNIRADFKLGIRDIAHYEATGIPFNTKAISDATIACARQEDSILFHGSQEVGLRGLLNTESVLSHKLKPWDDVGEAMKDIIAGVTKLDSEGFVGPYALALPSERYNLLFRTYPQGNLLEIDHVRSLVTEGVVRAPALQEGGVLLASGVAFASLVLGQDLQAGFVGPEGGFYAFSLTESLTLRVREPRAICVLQK